MKKFVVVVSVFMFISVLVTAQEVVLPINQQRTTNALTLKASPGTATSVPALTVSCRPVSLVQQNVLSWQVLNAPATFYIGTTSVTIKSGGDNPGTTFWYLTGMDETAYIDKAITYFTALSTSIPGVGGGIQMFSNLYSTGMPSTLLVPTTAPYAFGKRLTPVFVQPASPRTITWENNQSSFTIKSTGGLYPGTSNYNLKGNVADLVTALNAISSTTIGISGGILASTLITNAALVPVALLDTHSATNINGVPNTLTLNVTPTTSTVSYAWYGSSFSFKSTGGLYAGTTVFNYTQGTTLDAAIAVINNYGVGTQGIGSGIAVSRYNGYYPQAATAYLTPVLTYTTITATVSTMTSTASQGISYILSRNLLNVGQRWHVTGVSGNLTYSNGITIFKVYAGSNTTDTLIAQETIGATTVDKSFVTPGVDGCFVGAPYTDMRIDLVNDSTATTAGYLNIRAFKGYETPR